MKKKVHTIILAEGGEGIKLGNLSNGIKVRIVEAHIKDEFCNFRYEIISGVGKGFTHNVKGVGIVMPTMGIAFSDFTPHLAYADDIFKTAGVKVKNIDSMKGDEYTQLYEVTGFKIKGSDENESIILVGTKHLTEVGGRMELETPQIPIMGASSYTWHNELAAAADVARKEVELYLNGNYTVPKEEIIEEDPNQLGMFGNDKQEEGEGLNLQKVD